MGPHPNIGSHGFEYQMEHKRTVCPCRSIQRCRTVWKPEGPDGSSRKTADCQVAKRRQQLMEARKRRPDVPREQIGYAGAYGNDMSVHPVHQRARTVACHLEIDSNSRPA